jgi:DedD protein
MQINDEKFLRNLEIEQERAELERQKEELMSQKTQSYTKASDRYKNEEPEFIINYQELDDIRLNKNASNKQKYILLGFILVLLFLITIVTIKIISEPKGGIAFEENNTPINEKQMENEIQNINSIQPIDKNDTQILEADKVIQPETNSIQSESAKQGEEDIFGIAKDQEAVTVLTEQNIEPKKIEKPNIQTQKATIKESIIIKETLIKPKAQKELKKDIIKKFDTPKPEIGKEVKTTSSKISKDIQVSTEPFYIQIGVFSNAPDKALIEKLQKNNFQYTLQKLDKDGKEYSKLLVGSYKTKDQALEDLIKIRQEINPSAFIPKDK